MMWARWELTDAEVRAMTADLAKGWATVMGRKFDQLQAQLDELEATINADH